MKTNYYQPIIGLEVHVELKTNSKMFCGCSADYFGQKPNTHCCPVCLGFPGALPVPNKKAVEWCIKIGLALNCTIPKNSKFDRKNYFYPDLPKGYQISQYDMPLAVNGRLKLKTQNSKLKTEEEKNIEIRRVHLEEDTGKLLHQKIDGENVTLIDFNRGGVPLVEIVTEPCIHSAKEAKEYLQKLQLIIRYLGVSDCDMEKGTMRMEPNISLKVQSAKCKVPASTAKRGEQSQNLKLKVNEELPDYKVEVKNINSFKFVEKAIEYEIERQKELLEKGEKVAQETRGWDSKKGVTYSQRSKEEAKDYRYFPEPDIPPMTFTDEDINKIRGKITESPEEKAKRLISDYQISEVDAKTLITDRQKGYLLEGMLKANKDKNISAKEIINFIINKKVEAKTTPLEILEKIKASKTGIISDNNQLVSVIDEVIKENENAVKDFKNGKENALGFLIGMIMRKTKGKANAALGRKLLLSKISKM